MRRVSGGLDGNRFLFGEGHRTKLQWAVLRRGHEVIGMRSIGKKDSEGDGC